MGNNDNNPTTNPAFIEITSVVQGANATTGNDMINLGVEIVGNDGTVIKIAQGFTGAITLSAEAFLTIYENGAWIAKNKQGNTISSGNWTNFATIYTTTNPTGSPYNTSTDSFNFGSNTSEFLSVNLIQYGIVNSTQVSGSIDYFIANTSITTPVTTTQYGTWLPTNSYYDGSNTTDTSFTRVFGLDIDKDDIVPIDSHTAIDWNTTSITTENTYYSSQISTEVATNNDDYLDFSGKNQPQTINGLDGDDIIVGGNASDNINAGNGNDILVFDTGTTNNQSVPNYNGSYQDALIDGGAGNDTIILSGEYGTIDFSKLGSDNSKNIIKNVENIDLNVNGNHSLTNLSLQDVIDMTDTTDKTLKITGDSGDNVNLLNTSNANWSTNTTETVDNVTFNVYTNDQDPTYKVLVQVDINDTIS